MKALPLNRLLGAMRIHTALALSLALSVNIAQAQVAQSSFSLPSNQWAQIAVPGTLPAGSNTISAIFGQTLDTEQYEFQWVLYEYLPAIGTYDTVPISSTLEPGRAYWFLQRTSATVTINLPANTAEPIGTQNGAGSYVITTPLTDEGPPMSNFGWSLIGKPGTLNSRVQDLQITTTATGPCNSSTPCSMDAATTLGYVSDTLYAFNASTGGYDTYRTTDVLPDWQGFWFASRTSLPDIDGVSIQFPALAPTTNRFDDEFNAATLAQWEQRHLVENTSPQFTLLDMNDSSPGALAIEPIRTPGWFADGDAPLLYKLVTGNFSVETFVSAQSTRNPGAIPASNFNSAGLMARNPAGATQSENYIMVNVGQQNGVAGSETKTTRNSSSVLDIIPGSIAGRLILCRIGSTFHTYRWLDNEDRWTPIGSFARADLPSTLQVGMVANAFTGPDLRAEFDYIRLRTPQQESQCTGS
ncbi:MAG: hypothetical protein AB8B63_24485 [Granulosicoccus sp.]